VAHELEWTSALVPRAGAVEVVGLELVVWAPERLSRYHGWIEHCGGNRQRPGKVGSRLGNRDLEGVGVEDLDAREGFRLTRIERRRTSNQTQVGEPVPHWICWSQNAFEGELDVLRCAEVHQGNGLSKALLA